VNKMVAFNFIASRTNRTNVRGPITTTFSNWYNMVNFSGLITAYPTSMTPIAYAIKDSFIRHLTTSIFNARAATLRLDRSINRVCFLPTPTPFFPCWSVVVSKPTFVFLFPFPKVGKSLFPFFWVRAHKRISFPQKLPFMFNVFMISFSFLGTYYFSIVFTIFSLYCRTTNFTTGTYISAVWRKLFKRLFYSTQSTLFSLHKYHPYIIIPQNTTFGYTPWPDTPPQGMKVIVALTSDGDTPGWAKTVKVGEE
jgi:hypothetical protein